MEFSLVHDIKPLTVWIGFWLILHAIVDYDFIIVIPIYNGLEVRIGGYFVHPLTFNENYKQLNSDYNKTLPKCINEWRTGSTWTVRVTFGNPGLSSSGGLSKHFVQIETGTSFLS